MGVMPAKELAELPNPSLGGVLEAVVGPWGASLVNIGVIISLGGALFSYTTLKQAALDLEILTEEEFDEYVDPTKMC